MMFRKVVTGTAATLNVELGEKPEWIRVTNLTSMDKIEWNEDDSVNTNGRLTTASTGVVTKCASAAAGLALYSGTVNGAVTSSTDAAGKTILTQGTGYNNGITIGASAAVNVNTNKILIEFGLYKI